MLTYIARRLLLMFPTLLGITALVFFCMAESPTGIGGPMLQTFGKLNSVDARRIQEYYNRRYGLNKPAIVQYGRWLNLISPLGFEPRDDGTLGSFGPKWPSLGESLWRHRPVSDLFRESLPLTFLLNCASIPIVYAIGILSGIAAAQRRGQFYDKFSNLTQLAAWSVPTIWAGVMLIGFLANREYIELFPTSGLHEPEASAMGFLPHFLAGGFSRGWLLDSLWHLVLPVFCLSYGTSAFLTKLTRASLLENLSADFVRTGRAKGLAPRVVLYRHAFRNSVLSLITVAANVLPAMISGSVVVESIFSIHGMGHLAWEAVQTSDRELLLAIILVGSIITLLSQLLRDVLYAVADPRVAYE